MGRRGGGEEGKEAVGLKDGDDGDRGMIDEVDGMRK